MAPHAAQYPVVIYLVKDQIMASQPDLNIYRVKGKLIDLKSPADIGRIVLDIWGEVNTRLKNNSRLPSPSAKEAMIRERLKAIKFVSISRCARSVGVHPRTIQRLCKKEELDYIHTPGGHLRIRISERNFARLPGFQKSLEQDLFFQKVEAN